MAPLLRERGEALLPDEAAILAPWVVEAPREFKPESVAGGTVSEASG